MNIYEVIFLLSFILIIAITLVKLYYLMGLKILKSKETQFYDIKIALLSFVIFLISYLMVFIAVLNYPTIAIYSVVLALCSFLLILNGLFMLVEALLFMAGRTNSFMDFYKSNETKT